mmetsp:Transcript_31791/g.68133  ORF Transcript_31791/g.68133 Transcript_31791/m.68133 type:complete len:98 (+) Transcript_31791:355-648(+)
MHKGELSLFLLSKVEVHYNLALRATLALETSHVKHADSQLHIPEGRAVREKADDGVLPELHAKAQENRLEHRVSKVWFDKSAAMADVEKSQIRTMLK